MLIENAENLFGGWVVLAIEQVSIDCEPLGRDAQALGLENLYDDAVCLPLHIPLLPRLSGFSACATRLNV